MADGRKSGRRGTHQVHDYDAAGSEPLGQPMPQPGAPGRVQVARHPDQDRGPDLLRECHFLGRLGDPRCREALDLLEAKRLPDGGWPAEGKFYQRPSRELTAGADYVSWGGTGRRRTNEWVTVDALAVLRAAGRWGS